MKRDRSIGWNAPAGGCLAKQVDSSQSRIAKLEAGDASVSFDLMIRSLINVGAGPIEIANIIRKAQEHQAA